MKKYADINIRATKDTFKDFSVVIDELAKKWDGLSQVEQNAVTKALAGVRQRESLLVLMQNYGVALDLQTKQADAAGSAMKRYTDGFSTGTEAKINDLTNAIQRMWMSSLNSDIINGAIGSITKLVTTFDSLGGVVPILAGLLSGVLTAAIIGVIGWVKTLIVEGATLNILAGGLPVIIGLVATALTSLGVVIARNTSQYDELNKKQKLLEESYKSQIQNSEDSANSQKGEAEVAKNLADRLTTLNSIEKLNVGQKAEMKSIVDQLNQVLPNLNLQIDAQTGKIIGNTSAIYDNIAALKDQAIAQGYQAKATAAGSAYASQEELLGTSQSQLDTEDAKLNELKNRNKKALDEISTLRQKADKEGDSAEGIGRAIASISAKYGVTNIEQQVAEQQKKVDQLKSLVKEQTDTLSKYNSDLEKYTGEALKHSPKTTSSGNGNDPLVTVYKNKQKLQVKTSELQSYIDAGWSTSFSPPSGDGSTGTPIESQDLTEAFIKSYNAQVEIDKVQSKSLEKQIKTADAAKDYNKEIELTNKLLANQKKTIDDLNIANVKIGQQANKLRSQNPQYDTTKWFDVNGEATLAYQKLLNSFAGKSDKASKAEYDRIKDLFDALYKLKKGWSDNADAIDAMSDSMDSNRQKIQGITDDQKKLAQTLAKDVLEAEKKLAEAGLDQAEKDLKKFKEDHTDIIDGLQDQIDALDQQNELLSEQADREEKLKDIKEAQIDLDKAQQELKDIQNNKNVRVLRQGADGTYSWVWEADPQKLRDAIQKVEDETNKLKDLKSDYAEWERQNDVKHKKEALEREIKYQQDLIKAQEEAFQKQKDAFDEQWKNIDILAQKLLETYGTNLDKAVAELQSRIDALNAQLAALANLPIGTGGGTGTTPPPSSPSPTPASPGTATLPDGTVVPVDIVGGHTQTPNLPVGTVVHTGGGDYEIIGGTGGNYTGIPVNRTNHYASGTLSAEAGLARVNENGTELRVLNKGDGIVNAQFTKNLIDLAKLAPNLINNFRFSTPQIPSLSGGSSGKGDTIYNVRIDKVSANNGMDFINSMRRMVTIKNP